VISSLEVSSQNGAYRVPPLNRTNNSADGESPKVKGTSSSQGLFLLVGKGMREWYFDQWPGPTHISFATSNCMTGSLSGRRPTVDGG